MSAPWHCIRLASPAPRGLSLSKAARNVPIPKRSSAAITQRDRRMENQDTDHPLPRPCLGPVSSGRRRPVAATSAAAWRSASWRSPSRPGHDQLSPSDLDGGSDPAPQGFLAALQASSGPALPQHPDRDGDPAAADILQRQLAVHPRSRSAGLLHQELGQL